MHTHLKTQTKYADSELKNLSSIIESVDGSLNSSKVKSEIHNFTGRGLITGITYNPGTQALCLKCTSGITSVFKISSEIIFNSDKYIKIFKPKTKKANNQEVKEKSTFLSLS